MIIYKANIKSMQQAANQVMTKKKFTLWSGLRLLEWGEKLPCQHSMMKFPFVSRNWLQ